MAHGSLDGMASRDLALRFLLSALLYSAIGQTASHVDLEPEFLAPLENHTVTQGRDVSFTCVVNHLQSYRVAWIKSDSRAILAMHTHMVAPNPRLSVTHNGHNTWKLHVDDVRPEDSGTYMCQVNTDPMRSLVGHMKVVTPPDIIDLEEGADRLTSLEHGDVQLQCRATGNPKPEITWRREDGRDIVMRTDATTDIVVVKAYKNESLHLSKILRQEMGSYLCIASNGVPPSVSKRYYVNVYFKPTIKIRDPIVSAQIGMDVTLECYVESNPKSLTTWYTRNGAKLAQDERHEISESSINDFTFLISLTMRRVQQSDFSSYTCFTENSLGKTNVVFRLREERQAKVTSISKQFKHRNNTTALNKDEKNKKAPNDRLNSIANAEKSDEDMTSRNNGDILKHTDSNYQETYGSTDSRYLSGSASAIEILSDIVKYLTLTALIVILY